MLSGGESDRLCDSLASSVTRFLSLVLVVVVVLACCSLYESTLLTLNLQTGLPDKERLSGENERDFDRERSEEEEEMRLFLGESDRDEREVESRLFLAGGDEPERDLE